MSAIDNLISMLWDDVKPRGKDLRIVEKELAALRADNARLTARVAELEASRALLIAQLAAYGDVDALNGERDAILCACACGCKDVATTTVDGISSCSRCAELIPVTQ